MPISPSLTQSCTSPCVVVVALLSPRAEAHSSPSPQVDKSELHFKNRSSPYEGLHLTGAVTHTYLRGERVFSRASGFKGLQPIGQLLL